MAKSAILRGALAVFWCYWQLVNVGIYYSISFSRRALATKPCSMPLVPLPNNVLQIVPSSRLFYKNAQELKNALDDKW